jgi:hypothetical protein
VQVDIEDILAGALGSVVGRFLLFVAAAWLGCTVGAAALVAGHVVETGMWTIGIFGPWIWASPLLLFSSWALLNIPFLLYFLLRFIREEGDDFLTWGIVAGVQSLAVMAGWANDFVHGWLPLAAAWLVWLILLTMLGAGIWLIRQHLINSWARDIGMLRAEIARKRAVTEDEERAQTQTHDET